MRTHYLEQKRKWDALATTWIETGPPASPSDDDINIYKSMLIESLSGKTNGQVALLGCTPKIRKLFTTTKELRDIKLVCIDFSESMHFQTTKVLDKQNPNEKFFLGNWLDFNIREHAFDVILGDKAIDNIMPDDWDQFFMQLQYHLSPGGSFIIHLALADDDFRKITFESALEKWANIYDNSQESLGQIASGFWEDLLTASAYKDGYHNTVTISRFAPEVDAFLKSIDQSDKLRQEIFYEFKRIFWDSKDDLWSSYQYQEIIDFMGKRFSHKQTLFSTDYDAAKVQPIVHLTVNPRG